MGVGVKEEDMGEAGKELELPVETGDGLGLDLDNRLRRALGRSKCLAAAVCSTTLGCRKDPLVEDIMQEDTGPEETGCEVGKTAGLTCVATELERDVGDHIM